MSIKIWKDKSGKWITFKEFIKRFKEGIETINPLQRLKTQIFGTRIILIGLFLGLFVSIYGFKKLWWVMIILIGALINTGIQYLALVQQKNLLESLEKQFSDEEIPVPILPEEVYKWILKIH